MHCDYISMITSPSSIATSMPPMPQTWVDVTGNYTVDVTLDEAKGVCEICPITSEHIADCSLTDQLVTQASPMQVVELACNHRFNAMALIYHWMYSRMTCPLCNAGKDTQLSIENFQGAWAQSWGVQMHKKKMDALLCDLITEQDQIRELASNEIVNSILTQVLDNLPDNIEEELLFTDEFNGNGVVDVYASRVNMSSVNTANRASPLNDNDMRAERLPALLRTTLMQIPLQVLDNTTCSKKVITSAQTIAYLYTDSVIHSFPLTACIDAKYIIRVHHSSIRNLVSELKRTAATHIRLVTTAMDCLNIEHKLAETEKIYLHGNHITAGQYTQQYKDMNKPTAQHTVEWCNCPIFLVLSDIHMISCHAPELMSCIVYTHT